MVLLINVGVKGVIIDNCFEDARRRAPQLEWITTTAKPVVVSEMLPQIAKLGIVDRVLVLRLAKVKLEALRASHHLPNRLFDERGMHHPLGVSQKNIFDGNDDFLLNTETSDSQDHSELELSPQETPTSSSSPTLLGLASQVFPTVLTTALSAAAVAVSSGAIPSLAFHVCACGLGPSSGLPQGASPGRTPACPVPPNG